MLKKTCLVAGTCVVFFLLLEGLSSALLVAYELWSPEEHRTLSGPSVQYDEKLGWVIVPNFYEKNYYAPNIYLRTNSQGFRANDDFTPRVPAGKLRIICSGDSQTFGDGVENDHTWCQDLESLDTRLQTVNMAVTGYGVDQMYLRYNREGTTLDHDVHVFAFVTDDFRRMQLTNLVGYEKPVLKLQNGELATDNVPVPKESRFRHWLALKPHPLREFRCVRLMAWLLDRVLPHRQGVDSNTPTPEQRQIIVKMLEDLQAIEKQKNSILVLAYLPRESDYDPSGASSSWRTFISAESVKRGFVFADLLEKFQQLPVTTKDGLFIWPGSTQYFAETPGHYDDQGNEWVAKELYSKLISIPEIARRLNLDSQTKAASHGADSRVRSANTLAPSH